MAIIYNLAVWIWCLDSVQNLQSQTILNNLWMSHVRFSISINSLFGGVIYYVYNRNHIILQSFLSKAKKYLRPVFKLGHFSKVKIYFWKI